MLLFFSIILLIFIVILILIFSEVRIEIEDFEFSNPNKNFKLEYNGKICLYFMGKIKLLWLRINSKKTKKILTKKFFKQKIEKLKKVDNNQKKIQRQNGIKVIKMLKQKAKIKKLKFQMYLDTENVILTSYLVGIISSIIPNIIRNNIKDINHNNFNFKIFPLYKNQNYIYLKLSSIISIKLVHIINMFKLMGGVKNERTSNRRLNVNCYGKY